MHCLQLAVTCTLPTASCLELRAAALGTGGGVTQIVIPYITFGLAHHHPLFTAWRFTFLVPAAGHFIMAILILLLGQVGMQPIGLHAEWCSQHLEAAHCCE